MIRTATLLSFSLVFAAATVAAPVPPPSEKEILAKSWGKKEGEGEFEVKGKQLTLRTAGQPARGIIHGDRMNMPRVTRTVAGDFDATVKVVDAALPNKNKHEDAWPGTRAGVFIQGGGYAIELHLYQYFPKFNGVLKEEPTRVVWVDTWFPGGGAGSSLRMPEAGKSTYLRISRRGKDVTVSYSFDGKEWSNPFNPRQAMAFPDEITVGVFFSHSTYQIADATFDGFTVEKPKEKK